MEKKTLSELFEKIMEKHGLLVGYPSNAKLHRELLEAADSVKKAYAEQAVRADREQIIENAGQYIGCALVGERYRPYICDNDLRDKPIELP